ncbi:MAG TPA: AMP-binding protein [Acidimicrobiia bacterium]|nr:AMP-binding protein [Acidimicrobiia bacterium]
MTGPGDVVRLARTAQRAGLVRFVRPDRLWQAGAALRRIGTTAAATVTVPAALYPDRVAIVDERGPWTYRALDERSEALAHALAGLGLEPGSTAGVLCRNHGGALEVLVALAKGGVHAVLLNTGFAAPQLASVVANEHVRALFVDDEFLPLVARADLGLPIVRTFVEDPDSSLPRVDRLIDAHPAPPARVPTPRVHARTVILTSGTTGTPKGAPRDTSKASAGAFALLDVIPYHTDDTMVVAAPLFHAWGLANLSVALLLGGTVVLHRHFDPERTLAAVAEHRAQMLVAVPVMLQRILDLPEATRRHYDTGSLRAVPLSGSAIPGGLPDRFMDAFGDVLYNLYGSTEVGYATVASPHDLRAAPNTAGRPPAGTEVRILDDTGAPVPTGGRGRIFVRGPLVFDGYTDGNSKPVIDGAMSTGDVGWVDEHGRLFVAGRDDDMIVSGGENVFPREVEVLLEQHPDIDEVAVVGVPDDEFGQRLQAFVVRRPGATLDADAVRAHVRGSLARYKVPRDVEFVDALPRNATGKVLRRELRPGT